LDGRDPEQQLDLFGIYLEYPLKKIDGALFPLEQAVATCKQEAIAINHDN